MRKIVLSMHTTLDGFVGGPNGEMDWIKLDDTMFDFVGKLTDEADTALYGRVTYEMMDSYWPAAGDMPNASKHDIEHSNWYNNVNKIVISKSLQRTKRANTNFIGDDIAGEISKHKKQEGKNIQIFGSPSAVHSLMEHDLVDEFWLFVNPIILGNGIPLFSRIKKQVKLIPLTVKEFACGVTALHYSLEK